MNMSTIASESASDTVNDSRWEAVILAILRRMGPSTTPLPPPAYIAGLLAARACRDVKTCCFTRRGRKRRTPDSGRANVQTRRNFS